MDNYHADAISKYRVWLKGIHCNVVQVVNRHLRNNVRVNKVNYTVTDAVEHYFSINGHIRNQDLVDWIMVELPINYMTNCSKVTLCPWICLVIRRVLRRPLPLASRVCGRCSKDAMDRNALRHQGIYTVLWCIESLWNLIHGASSTP